MAALKAHEVDTYLKRKAETAMRFFLVYGPDRGLVNERCGLLAARAANSSSLEDSLIKLEGGDIEADPARLDDELRGMSLFGGPRIVWLRVDGKSIEDAIAAALADPPRDVTLIVEAGDLKPTSPLRKSFEKTGFAMALPCYSDDARTLTTIVDEELRKENVSIDPDARRVLLDLLGGDRQATRQEVQKLCLYVMETKKITLEDIEALSGDVSSLSYDSIFDQLGLGETANGLRETQRHLSAGTHGSVLLGFALRHMMMLQLLRSDVDLGRTTTDAIKSAAPPIFFKRQPFIERQLVLWSLQKIDRALQLLNEAILKTRQLPQLTDALTERALIELGLLAKTRLG